MDDVRPKMRFSLSPSSPKAIFSSTLTSSYRCSSDHYSVPSNAQNIYQNSNNNKTFNNIVNTKNKIMQHQEDTINLNDRLGDEESSSDYKQWLHAMKLVARLPGGIPPEFRRKLWLSLADKYLKSKNVDWTKEEEKCFCEKWREDDEELGIQIVKDLHRTGSTLCTGPAGDINQAKLKKILLGYARYNPEVGYCQGFNMLGALILQVMDKNESESIKVMIYLVEGILPTGYFCGSMRGLQADMAVFRELMQTKLPRLAKHLQKLQDPVENAYEPPLTNVFTMQWFLTMFCTCLPMSCVLRVWDLVLIEGSDILLRTALVLWSLLEERVLSARSADDFYGKMGSFSTELLNGHLIDSNGLIEKVVQLGPIADIQKLRDKHLCNMAPLKSQQGLQFYYDEDGPDIDEDSRLVVATVWGIHWGRRGSQVQSNNPVLKQPLENKDRIALDISLLKKQYDRLRERQKQAHIILTTACSTARQSGSATPLPVSQLLSGRSAIITKKGRRSGPPTGVIPPARKPSLPVILHEKPLNKQLQKGETLHWREANDARHRRDSLTWKEIKAERAALISSGSVDGLKSQKIQTHRLGKSDSSSYSEESDDNDVAKNDGSSTDTSLCDDEFHLPGNSMKEHLNAESKAKPSFKSSNKTKKIGVKYRNLSPHHKEDIEKNRPRSWAPSNSDIPFVLMTTDSPSNSAEENFERDYHKSTYSEDDKSCTVESKQLNLDESNYSNLKDPILSPLADDLVIKNFEVPTKTDSKDISIKSDLQTLSPILKPNIISEEPTNTNAKLPLLSSTSSLGRGNSDDNALQLFDVSDEGVINEYFERINSSERPNKLELLYSLNEEEDTNNAFRTINDEKHVQSTELPNDKHKCYTKNTKCMDILVDYSEKSSVACIEEAKSEISTSLQTSDVINSIPLRKEYPSNTINHIFKKTKGSAEKRRDPRRLTLTRSSTMDIEKRYQALEKRLSMDICPKHKSPYNESEVYNDSLKNDNNLPYSKVPSTAELEKRFKLMEISLARDINVSSPCDSEKNSKQTCTKLSNTDNEIATNNSPYDRKSPQKNDEDNHSKEKDDKEIDRQKTLPTHSDIKRHSSTLNVDSEYRKPDTIGSTELQSDPDSKIIISKTKTLQNKKEPPDDAKSGHNIHDIANETCLNEKLDTETNDTKMSIEEDPQNVKNIKENDINKVVVLEKNQTNFDPINERNQEIAQMVKDDKIKTKSENNENSLKRTVSQKKSPPSIEELEKRFSALEKQMSCNKTESNGSENDRDISTEQDKQITTSENEEISKTKKNVLNTLVIDTPNTATSSNTKTDITETSETSSKRRLSEPPSTEDLEKRYEVLKRRMSSRNFETRTLFRAGILDESERIRKNNATESSNKIKQKEESPTSSNKHSPPSIENLEDNFLKLNNKTESKDIPSKQSHASTEILEERSEELQSENNKVETNKSNTTIAISSNNKTSSQSEANTITHRGSNEDDKKHLSDFGKQAKEFSKELGGKLDQDKTTLIDSNRTNDKPIKVRLIEELQSRIIEKSINLDYKQVDINSNVQKKLAVIEELKTKMKTVSNDFVKPSQIPSNRRPPPTQSSPLASHSSNDETLESHATSAYCRSGKYEPINSSNRKMVRRFSDLPSRADLENRLQFLEEQLSKMICKQRRSSDSEVASKSRQKNVSHSNVPHSNSLEHRVYVLEKHLKNSKTLSMDVECASTKEKTTSNPEIEVSQIELESDSAAITGKELVRYSSSGEVEDIEHQNPINISINIQMTLNKDAQMVNKKNIEIFKTEELDNRLKFLEQQLKISNIYNTDVPTQSNESGKQNNKNIVCNSKEQLEVLDRQEPTEVKKITNKKIYDQKDNEYTKEDQSVSDNQSGFAKDTISKNSEYEQNETVNNEESVSKCPDNRADVGSEFEETKQHTEMKISSQISEESQHKKNEEVFMCAKGKTVENIHDESRKIKEKDDAEEKPSQNMSENKSNTLKNTNRSLATESSTHDNTTNSTKKPIKNVEQPISPVSIGSLLTNASEKVQKPGNGTGHVTEIETMNETDTIPMTESCNKSEIGKNIFQNDSSNVAASAQIVPIEVNKKTLVLLLDNEPKAVKVRRLTRANTEELEDLFQALEKQLSNRCQDKKDEEKEENKSDGSLCQKETETAKATSDLAKEIETFYKSELNQIEKVDEPIQSKQTKCEEEFDWGNDPIKLHLKKKTVYLPSTKELEARFRSLERQIKLLEDVEKIDIEQRLLEIERKIKLQYSLSHEQDLNKFLELCEGKGIDEITSLLEKHKDQGECYKNKQHINKPTSPNKSIESASLTDNPKYQHHIHDLKRSKSKQNLKKQPIHPLEMLLDPSPDDNEIPTTGELEHRIRVMEERHYTPSPTRQKSCSQSPPSLKSLHNKTKSNTHFSEIITASPTERELPTAEQLEARLEALEKEQCFNYKMQKNFQQFNQKLKDVISPSLSSDNLNTINKSSDSKYEQTSSCLTSKKITGVEEAGSKTIRFQEKNQSGSSVRNEAVSVNTFKDSQNTVKGSHQAKSTHEGLAVMGIRLMRETSPLRRKGTHTGVPLRTGENINDRLTSIKNTIKSIDTLCEEKPYRKERCQQYIDSLFSDSTYFAIKKSSLEDLTSRNLNRPILRDTGRPVIRISEHSPTFTRSMGSAESIRSSSPARAASPLQYRSNRDLRRDPSPRHRRVEDCEEHESRVRRDNILPNIITYNDSILSHTSHSSLTKFHKVDSQLIPKDAGYEESLRYPTLLHSIDKILDHDSNTNTSTTADIIQQHSYITTEATTKDPLKSHLLNRPVSPYRLTGLPNTSPVYTPTKLEIRHTTVTSTFYDRIMTEKQLEKQQQPQPILSNNRSPMVSPLFEKYTTKNLHNDSASTMILSEASPGNYHSLYQQHHIQAHNDG